MTLRYINDNYNNLPKSLLKSLDLDKRDIKDSDLDEVLVKLFTLIDYAQINKYILSSLNFDNNIEKDDYIKNLIKNLFTEDNKIIKYQDHIIDVNVYYFLDYILNQPLNPNSNLINDVLKYLEKVPEELSSKIDKQKINNEQITETISNYLQTILNNLKNINYYNFDKIILNEINSLDLSLENKIKLKKFFKKKGFNLIIQENFNADALSIADKIDTYWAPKRAGKQSN